MNKYKIYDSTGAALNIISADVLREGNSGTSVLCIVTQVGSTEYETIVAIIPFTMLVILKS